MISTIEVVISQKWGPYVGWSTTLTGVASPFSRTPAGMLGLGSTGDEVRRLQNALIAKGVIVDSPGNHDGVFGPGLDTAVRRFQQEQNLVVDGFVGAQTWSA